ncbi:hypothetical protein BO70DRAFT_359380 [Aspergillus heteromorphus CBS 117.55]|uniref:PAC domain-containing protein n=1 Tax=Aspergillus heteromorphus CBS 117.55 TaxID=1448321 RepID=A0A317WV24_9EURO|nr:uncharacterized protein BO70DRAFT_359380 [Aspergillus heteromorphus CBS 117.55]PWY89067.1 hypothetical protein BO70DRAFT_359380 [Aspergillus heteromorphus CBS 117.55]
MDRYPSSSYDDAASLRSYPSTVALDDYPPPLHSHPPSLISGFPRPPSRAHILDHPHPHPHPNPNPNPNPTSLTSRPSLKTLRRNYMVNELPLLQQQNPYDGSEQFHPVQEAGLSYDLIAPFDATTDAPLHDLERLADLMFSPEHMLSLLNNPRYLARFREFLLEERPRSLRLLTYYLNARKALKAIEYANALVRCCIDLPLPALPVAEQIGETTHPALQRRVQEALQALTDEELPAFITSRCINITSRVVEERVRGTLPQKFQGTSDALAEVFCLTDPSRRDNPIIFASEEFHRTTQYGMDYVLGRNCRFLQGPHTNPCSVRRIREALAAGRHHSELFLNYRRDGSPFMNLLQCAPLCDSHGTVRYFIGAQIDVSGLAMDGAQMESLRALQEKQRRRDEGLTDTDTTTDTTSSSTKTDADTEPEPTTDIDNDIDHDNDTVMDTGSPAQKTPVQPAPPTDEFRDLSELFSPRELGVARDVGGNLFQPVTAALDRTFQGHSRTWSMADTVEMEAIKEKDLKAELFKGSLTGVYENYLLVRPYPSLRILFTSPSLQIPGMLQTSFLSRIGSSSAVRDELLHALMSGRSVTARIKWVTRFNAQGRDRWVHCTPLLASNGEVGVWMVVVVDEE